MGSTSRRNAVGHWRRIDCSVTSTHRLRVSAPPSGAGHFLLLAIGTRWARSPLLNGNEQLHWKLNAAVSPWFSIPTSIWRASLCRKHGPLRGRATIGFAMSASIRLIYLFRDLL